MALEVTGKLHKKFATEARGASGFQTREFVLEIMDGNYQQLIKFQLIKDACTLLDKFNEQDDIKVEFNLDFNTVVRELGIFHRSLFEVIPDAYNRVK